MRTGPSGILFSSASTAVAANVFLLRFLSRQTSSLVVVLLCREPCLNLGALEDQGGTSPCGSPLLRTEPSCRFSSRCVCGAAHGAVALSSRAVNRPAASSGAL